MAFKVPQDNGYGLCWFDNLIKQGTDIRELILEASQHVALIGNSKVTLHTLDHYELLRRIPSIYQQDDLQHEGTASS